MAAPSRRSVFGLGIGAASGVLDTALGVHLGLDFQIAGRDLTAAVALYLAASFGLLGYVIGRLLDARERERRDARTIREQMQALEDSRRVAAQNEKLAAIGRLAAGVAHEVRNPLGVIRASASMVQEGFDAGDEAHRACRFICEEIDRLNGLITSLLGFARPAEPHVAPVSLEKVVERALQLAGEELHRREIAVRRETRGALPEIQADPDLIAQVALGLLTNAAEALERGGQVELRLGADAGGVSLEVADDGPGVAPAEAERVFEPFFTTKTSGTGLGLAMMARIAESHGGHLALRPGGGAGPGGSGACFRLRLPLAPPAAEARLADAGVAA